MNDYFGFSTYKNFIYKTFIPIFSILLLTFFFSNKKVFNYNFYKNKHWNYENLYSPFNFKILKNNTDLKLEIDSIKKNQDIFCIKKENIEYNIKKNLRKNPILKSNRFLYQNLCSLINIVYKNGIIDYDKLSKKNNHHIIFFQKKMNNWVVIPYKKIYTINMVYKIIEQYDSIPKKNFKNLIKIKKFLKKVITPNFLYDKNYTDYITKYKIKSINRIKFSFRKGDLIIEKHEYINKNLFQILSFIKNEYKKKIWNNNKYYGKIIGYSSMISIILTTFILYLYYFQNNIFNNNKKINFLMTNILIMSLITITIMKYNPKILYIIPFCVLPLSMYIFFDFNLSMMIHCATVLLLSLITPDSLEFIILQLTSGFLVMIKKKNVFNMEDLFFSALKITITYIICFFSIALIRKGSLKEISLFHLFLFTFSGFSILFIHPLIFLFEKILNVTSDISLYKLSNANNPILKLLSKNAPGTLQHVFTVSNLAEEAALSIGADSLLTKIGSIYHDIGKIKNPNFFNENQYKKNLHEKLNPKESARIILEHVTIGIKLAKKYHLPNPIIDFIRTHHGNSFISFFYKKEKKKHPNIKIDKKKFQYPGPIPFSKETAIVMIADSLEAASKSINNPSSKELDHIVDKIIYKKQKDNQLSNVNITLKEIEILKKIFKKKLKNIYHTRINNPKY